MGKTLKYVQEEETGRLVFRGVYPRDVIPFLPAPKSVLKIPLGAHRFMTAEAFRTYERAKRQFDEDVKMARAAKTRHEKEQEGRRDAFTPDLIKHLADLFAHLELSRVEEAMRTRGGDWADRALAGWEWHLDEFQRWKVEADLEEMENHWGRTADALLHAEGVLVDPEDNEGRERLLWALNDAALRMSAKAQRQLVGHPVDIPARPDRPAFAKGPARTVSALLDAYRAEKWEGWSQSSRAAIEPVFRVLREALGDRPVATVSRDDARDVLGTVRKLPANLGKLGELKGLSVSSAIEKAQDLGLPAIGPGTINRGYMVHISAIFNFAVREQWVPSNPFVGLGVPDPVAKEDKRNPFTTEQLGELFSKSPWDIPASHDMDKPGAYWLPLIALFMGARRAEIAGLRLLDVEEIDGTPAIRIRPYQGRSVKNDGSRRDLPIHPALIRLGLLEFIAHRREVAKPEDPLFPDGKPNVNGKWGAKLGEWFSQHLKERNITGKVTFHSFRHNWEDRLRAGGLHGTSLGKALGGRKVGGSEGAYGQGFTIGDLQAGMEKVSYPGLDLSHLKS